MLQQQGFLRFRVDACPQQPLLIPDFGGSMLRGALGHALAYLDEVAYAKIFDTGLGHAFLITPPEPQKLSIGTPFTFYITLFPQISGLQKIFFRGLDLALRKGLSAAQVPCELLSLRTEPAEFSPLPSQFKVSLLSPWFVKYRGEPVAAESFSFNTFIIAVVRRQRELVRRGHLRAQLPSNQTLLELAQDVHCSTHVHDVFGQRRSNRQQAKHRLQGVSGYLKLEIASLENLQLLNPLLHRAEWLHGGSKVSFGQGALQVQPLHSSVSQLEQLRQIATGAAL